MTAVDPSDLKPGEHVTATHPEHCPSGLHGVWVEDGEVISHVLALGDFRCYLAPHGWTYTRRTPPEPTYPHGTVAYWPGEPYARTLLLGTNRTWASVVWHLGMISSSWADLTAGRGEPNVRHVPSAVDA